MNRIEEEEFLRFDSRFSRINAHRLKNNRTKWSFSEMVDFLQGFSDKEIKELLRELEERGE